MRFLLLISILLLLTPRSFAQQTDDWNRLRHYANVIGIDSLCANPDADCLTRYFTEIVYGHKPRRMHFVGIPERIDTGRIHRLTQQFLVGADWCPLLDSLESKSRTYRQLKEYCMRCLIDDYIADSLTIEQIQETLNSYRWLNRFTADKRIIVNIPSATLLVVNPEGNTLLSSRVIVGKPGTPTPIFSAGITGMVLYPYWNIPRSILIKEILPAVRKNPEATLEAMKLQVIDANGQIVAPSKVNWSVSASAFPYRLRQSTGCDNALGLLKFTVNDPYDVYLHDTNSRTLFQKENRYLSHGCIRVEKPVELANLLLGYTRFKPSYMTSCPVNATPKTLTLPQAVPVVITYNVVDMDDQGAVRVYRDVYNWWRFLF